MSKYCIYYLKQVDKITAIKYFHHLLLLDIVHQMLKLCLKYIFNIRVILL